MFILEAMREKDKNDKYFLAGIQGIDLKKSNNDPIKKRIEEVKRRAAVKQLGEEEVKREEFAVMGFGYVAEE